MMKAAVVIDDWKLAIFEDELRKAGFSWKQFPGITKDTITLQVETPSLAVLQPVVQRAYDRAKRSKMN